MPRTKPCWPAMAATPAHQLALPLSPQEPSPGQVQAEAGRLLQQRPHLRRRYPTLAQALADPLAAKALLVCARLALLARQRTSRFS